jgi:ABC-type glycerol-3-phosphate transport system permease component
MTFTFLYPLYFMVINAVKTREEYLISQISFPSYPAMRNFKLIITDFHILRYFKNTLIVVLSSLSITLALGICSSYAFAKLRFIGKRVFYLAILATMFMPGQVSLIPAYVMFSRFGLINNYWSVILSYLAGDIPGVILLLTSYFMNISRELIDSAKIDGAGYFPVVKNIIIPLGAPSIAICVIFSFVGKWNDLLTPMLFLSGQERQTVTVALNRLAGRYSALPTQQTAGFILSIIPVFVLYLILQKYMIRGLTEGALK